MSPTIIRRITIIFPPGIFFKWLRYFILTLVVEAPVYTLISRKDVPARRAVLAAVACSAVTHPLLWFAWKPMIKAIGGGYSTYIVSGELLVGVIEGFIFYAVARPSKFSTALGASFIANACSYGVGAVCNYYRLLA